jgi:hypothetical protein
MEQLTLTAPVVETRTTYSVKTFTMRRDLAAFENSTITVEVQDNLGNVVTNTYGPATTPTGSALLSQLNKANFSVNSLQKQVINRLMTDGFLPAGSVTGTAD